MQRILDLLNAAILLAMFVVTVLTVIFRDVLSIPASWSDDLAQFTFILLVFLGAASVTRDDAHLKITSFVDRLPPGGQRAMRQLCRLLTLPFLLVFGIGAWRNAVDNWEIALGTVDWIRIGQIYLFLLVSAAIMGWYIVDLMIRDWHDGHRKAQ